MQNELDNYTTNLRKLKFLMGWNKGEHIGGWTKGMNWMKGILGVISLDWCRFSDRRGSCEIFVVVEEWHAPKGETSDIHLVAVFHSMRNQFLQVNPMHISDVSSVDF
jgi:hypothetical protein